MIKKKKKVRELFCVNKVKTAKIKNSRKEMENKVEISQKGKHSDKIDDSDTLNLHLTQSPRARR